MRCLHWGSGVLATGPPGKSSTRAILYKGTTEDEMVGWYHWLDGRGFGWTPGVGEEQGGLGH